MLYKQIECPTCGNTVDAKSIKEPQKCRWCRRLFKVSVVRRNKEGRKGKFDWTAKPVEFDDSPKARSLSSYSDEDIYGM